MESYDKSERGAPDADVFDGNPSSGSEGEESNPYVGAAGADAFVSPVALIPQDNDNATFSLALGIVTWICHIATPFLCFTVCIAPITTVIGIVLGHLGLRDARNMNGLRRNEAIFGLVLNYSSLAGYGLLVVGGGALFAGFGQGLT
ncbi:MAG: DUF4190 domain-containing protein [Candidatus Thermoplasmatota archaeon]|nr:DUF4190 domain-containing protein [Candidatus Thermoplasmatota archaeon]